MNTIINDTGKDSLEGILKTLSELFHSANGQEIAIGYLETIKAFIKEQRTPNETEIEYYTGILNLIQGMLRDKKE